MPQGYPIVLNAAGLHCLILGEGREADEKAAALAACGATIHREAEYRPGTLRSYQLVVAASPDRSRNAAIFSEAEQAGVLVNCVDDPEHCRFTFASVVRRGELLVAISTGGACPALSVRLRERLERELGPEYERFLVLARAVRDRLSSAVPGFQERKAIWYALVDSALLDQLRDGDEEGANETLKSILPPGALP